MADVGNAVGENTPVEGETRTIKEDAPEELTDGAQYHGEAMFHEGKWVQHGEGSETRASKNTYTGEWLLG